MIHLPKVRNHGMGIAVVAALITLLSLSSSVNSGGVTDQLSGISSKSVSAFVEQFSAKYVGSHVPGISVAVVKDGKTIHSSGHGLANRSKSVDMTGSTPIRVGGLTQLITLIAVIQQQEAERISATDPIDSFFGPGIIPNPSKYANIQGKVTVADTLAHAGGWEYKQMGVYAPGNRVSSNTSVLMSDFPRRVRAQGRAPITYSYHGYAALGEIVARVTEQDFVEYVHENIFEPLNMVSATVRGHDSRIPEPPAVGYSTASSGFHSIDVYGTSPASSGLCASASDMAQLLKVFTGNGKVNGVQVITKKSLAECFSVHVPVVTGTDVDDQCGTSLGWFKSPLRNNLGHAWVVPGDAPGFTSFAAVFPKNRIGVFFAGNGQASGLGTEFLNEFAAQFGLTSVTKDEAKPKKGKSKGSSKSRESSSSSSIQIDLSNYTGYYKPAQSSQTMWEVIAHLTSQIHISKSPSGNTLLVRGINVDELTVAQVSSNMKKMPGPVNSSSGHAPGVVELTPVSQNGEQTRTMFRAVTSSGDEYMAAIFAGGVEMNAPEWYLATNSLGHNYPVTYQRIHYLESSAFVLPTASLALSVLAAYTVVWLIAGLVPMAQNNEKRHDLKPDDTVGRLFNITAYNCVSHLLFVALMVTGVWKNGGLADVLAMQRLPLSLRFVFFGSFVCMNLSIALGVNIFQEARRHSVLQGISSGLVFLASVALMVVHYQMRLWILNV